MTDIIKMIEQLLLVKAGIELMNTDNKKIKGDLLDYIDTLLADYNKEIEDFEEHYKEENKRSIH